LRQLPETPFPPEMCDVIFEQTIVVGVLVLVLVLPGAGAGAGTALPPPWPAGTGFRNILRADFSAGLSDDSSPLWSLTTPFSKCLLLMIAAYSDKKHIVKSM